MEEGSQGSTKTIFLAIKVHVLKKKKETERFCSSVKSERLFLELFPIKCYI